MPLPAPSPAIEISNLRFHNILASPILAAIQGQVSSSISTANFITSVGFKSSTGIIPGEDGEARELVTLPFKYTVKTAMGTFQPARIEVPLVTMIPFPCLRILEVQVTFQVNIRDTFTAKSTSQYNEQGSNLTTQSRTQTVKSDDSEYKKMGLGFFSSSLVNTKTTRTGLEVTREYSLEVSVRAATGELPRGLSLILEALEKEVQARPEN